MSFSLASQQIENSVREKLEHHFGISPENATNDQYYKACALMVNEMLSNIRSDFFAQAEAEKMKRIYYLCMEFLPGRSLKNNLYNLGLEQNFREALTKMGIRLDDLYEEETDAGLGNGGLGRLASCFMDALASQGYAAMGYSLRYEYGIFRQKLVDGWQTELPDFWLPSGRVWMQEIAEDAVEVHFDGHIEESWDNNYHTAKHVDYTKVTAVPYDICISGKDGKGVSVLRVWKAQSGEFDMKLFNGGNYMRAMEQNAMAEIITKVLYPEDNHLEGKSLRLTQQYFLVSATMQDIIRRYLFTHKSLDDFPEHTAIHLNETHPVLAIPEMMRIMLDECGYTWDNAWDIVLRTFSYTNHTVMAEALECWKEDLFKMRMPRIYQIVEEINRRYWEEMKNGGVDYAKIARMAPIGDGYVKMANLAVLSSYSVNGVSRLHSEILKESVFHDFYTLTPYKFKNVTNGIAHRRWLCQANPKLAELITSLCGTGFVRDAQELEKLLAYRDRSDVLAAVGEIKHANKVKFAAEVKKKYGITVDPESIYDVQAKRMHEYKRQHMNALQILSLYRKLRENPSMEFTPHTYFFCAKSAPGYYFAKQMIRLISALSETINADARVNDRLRVYFLENYNVTMAEKIIPAADISEQISLAGTEASGTSNMKFMINGALTLGTLDGANVEIHDAIGDDNMILFGMNAGDVNALKASGYHPDVFTHNNPELSGAIEEMSRGIAGVDFRDIVNSLSRIDPYMVLADFDAYAKAQKKAAELYRNREAWNRAALINIANAGRFAADRAVNEYAKNIWGASPLR